MFDMQIMIKYLLEALVISLVVYFVYKGKFDKTEIIKMGVIVVVVLLLTDTFAPQIASGIRFGTGFGIGTKLAQVV